MQGFDAECTPRWDCHGLPIDMEDRGKIRKTGKNKDGRRSATPHFRAAKVCLSDGMAVNIHC
ncbi:hypothetical protein [Azospirillum sp.]|uniref:hypothetical protein n=1 Tax=Azospirillum sp. TaxID=34012 RepID=UPI002623F7A3|nr:hypothetical protein [Azospirillum sp.]